MPTTSTERLNLSDGEVCSAHISTMKQVPFHLPKPVATGVRLLPDFLAKSSTLDSRLSTVGVRPLNQHPLFRLISVVLTLLLFLSSSPVLFASMARDAMGGGASAGGKGGAANLQNAGAASASLTAARARAVLKQSDAQVAAMKALQANARSMISSGGVPNGLAVGGLNPYNPSGLMNPNAPNVPKEWSGIRSLNQSGNTVTVAQSTQNAYLYWNQFNVGQQTTLNFDQSAGGNDVGNWIAFNKVMGNVSPSHIYGQITAQGQVYILNQNGILFHNGSQVNTHALVASTLPINENLAGDGLKALAAQGIVNNPNNQFLFTALQLGNSFTPVVNGPIGNVEVEAGASISSPANASHTGGLVALIGPKVKNSGSISTPNGQTILAAGLQVSLSPHSSSDPSLRGMDVTVGKVSGSLNGAAVQTTASADEVGTAENFGLIEVKQGNATIAGKTVRNGSGAVIESSTSVSLNGRVDLMANYNAFNNPAYIAGNGQPAFVFRNTGVVDLQKGSLIRILPEWESKETITGSALALNSLISIIGLNINLKNGTTIFAPGAIGTKYTASDGSVTYAKSQLGQDLLNGVTLNAGGWLVQRAGNMIDGADDAVVADPAAASFYHARGRITLSPSATINVAGSTGIQVDSAQNILTLQLRGSELANQPLQRSGPIRGKSIIVDARNSGTYSGQYWVGTPLGDATGFSGLIERSVGQLTTKGGTLSMMAGDSVDLQSGSKVDVSGGWVQYSAAKVATTKLKYQGHLVDISQATPDRVYDGTYTGGGTVERSSKWGVTKTYGTSPLDPSNKQSQPAYMSGDNAGSIAIQAPSIALNGELLGNTVVGPKQQRANTTQNTAATSSSLPQTATLGLNFSGDTVVQNVMFTGSRNPPAYSVPSGLVSPGGFGHLTVLNHDGSIKVDSDTTLNLGVNGSVSLEAGNVDVEGSIVAPGGIVTLKADLTPYSVLNALSSDQLHAQSILDVLVINATGEKVAQYGPSKNGVTEVVKTDGTHVLVASQGLSHLKSGLMTVGSTARISTAGLLLNDAVTSSGRYATPIAMNGGTISINGYETRLQKGALLDVSGGVLIGASGKPLYGNAGSIAISGGQDSGRNTIHNGSLSLEATLKGYGGIDGSTPGTLSVTAPVIQIGGTSLDPRILNLPTAFFNTGGFGTFNLSGYGLEVAGSSKDFVPGISVSPGTTIHPQVVSQMVAFDHGTPLLGPKVLDDPYRPAPSISLSALGIKDNRLVGGNPLLVRGDAVLGAGASVLLDPQLVVNSGFASAVGGGFKLQASSGTVAMLGSVVAPGGTVSITGASTYPNLEQQLLPQVTVEIAPSASISTAGLALYAHDPLNQRPRFGAVLPGGSISIQGNILGEKGAVLDASGSSGTYDYFPDQLGLVRTGGLREMIKIQLSALRVDSQGGSISLSGSEMLYSDMTLMARSGGSTALGGSLSIQSGRFYAPNDPALLTDLVNPNLVIAQDGMAIPTAFKKTGISALGEAMPGSTVSSKNIGIPNGGGHVTVGSFANGGFDAVTLGGNVLFKGPVSMNLPGSIKVATGGVLYADSTVSLTAPYIALGRAFVAPLALDDPSRLSVFDPAQQTLFAKPSWGPGKLDVHARLIDVGNLSLNNIGVAVLDASGGSIRGDGTFAMAGELTMRAAQIYPATGTKFEITAYNHDASGAAVSGAGIGKGKISIERSGSASLPLSAGGTLSLYADSITQRGVLVAPFGSINLGWDGTGTSPVDPISGISVPTASKITLVSGSVTTVSGLDSETGNSISVPYGTTKDGKIWTDPSGANITTEGLPYKSVTVAGANIVTESGSLIDLRGGGEVTLSQWVQGTGGKINIASDPVSYAGGRSYAGDFVTDRNGTIWSATQDSAGQPLAVGPYWSKVSQSYAVIPGYQPDFAPTGYADGTLGIGSKIKISAGSGLAAGSYTLLPSSYANQPGAFLITPLAASRLAGAIAQPDGSVIVSGTPYNGLQSAPAISGLSSLYKVSSPLQIAAMSKYTLISADTFFKGSTTSSRPSDAAYLLLNGASGMSINGAVRGWGASGGHGSIVDISSTKNFLISGNSSSPSSDAIVLNASLLSSWRVGSLLVGGIRVPTADKTSFTTTPSTSRIVVDNAGSPLTSGEVILASKNEVTLKDNSSIRALGTDLSTPIAVSGNGAMVRVSSDLNASTTRTGNDQAGVVGFQIGAGANLSGASITLDSSGNASIASTAVLDAKSINLSSGKMAIDFDGSSQAGMLNLSGSLLQRLSTVQSLNLTSYSSIEFHGGGVLGSASLLSLGLHAGELLGDNLGTVGMMASLISLDNANGSIDPSGGVPAAAGGSLSFTGNIMTFGSGAISIGGFQNVGATMSSGIQTTGKGSMITAGNLTLSAPLITGASGAVTSIKAGGSLNITDPGTASLTPGLGASLSLQGSSVSISAPILLPSGSLSVKATTGNLTISSLLDVGGTSRQFFDVTQYTDAGSISLSSDNGNLILTPGATLNLSAQPAAGNAGSLTLSAPNGIALLGGLIDASAANGTAGFFTADLGSYNGGNLDPLENLLTSGGFSQSQNIRLRNDPNVTLTAAKAHSYTLSADAGLIRVNGTIDASGTTGGNISLFAGQSVVVTPGSLLTVHGRNFDNAGKGGSIDLEAGNNPTVAVIAATAPGASFANGTSVVDLQAGATLDLGVDAIAGLGQASGTLHLRAPQTTDNSDLQINPVKATITGASSINLEGFFRQDAVTIGTAAIDNYEATALNNANLFMAHFATIGGRVGLPMTPANVSVLQVNPGEEIVNSLGSLVLNADWDLSLARYGQQLHVTDLLGNDAGVTIGRDPGFLSLRAKGDITFNGSLSDGFGDSINTADQALAFDGAAYGLYFAPLLPILTDNSGAKYGQKSWSYRITAGGESTSANPMAMGSSGTGNIKIGIPTANANSLTGDPTVNQTANALAGNYQVIRTGTGDIALSSGRDIQLLNQFATIYTAGSQVVDPTLGGNFDTPLSINSLQNLISLGIGAFQQNIVYYPQYSVNGGNVSLMAGGNIAHLQTLTQQYYTDPHTGAKTEIQTPYANDPTLTADSSREIPLNWLMRRGNIGADGKWVSLTVADQQTLSDELTSTTWWVNFANYFEGVGALAGGNVTMIAKGDISNVDASVPTQGRVTARSGGAVMNPSQGILTETGGGNITVKSGGNLDAGVYYVERGNATIHADGSIFSNKTRDVNGDYLYALTDLQNRHLEANPDSKTFMPTSFLLGRGNISVTANGSALVGPVANLFLLPQGINNDLSYRSYLSTYDLTGGSGMGSSYTVQALGGELDFRTQILGAPSFSTWALSDTIALSTTHNFAGAYQPWIMVNLQNPAEASLTPISSLLPPSVSLAAFNSDISLEGNILVSPSSLGNLSVYASGSINGINQQGIVSSPWAASTLNLSDASPSLFPGVMTPMSGSGSLPTALAESGSFNGANGALQTKLLRHGSTLLHQADPEPMHLYAQSGDISGLTLYSPKKTQVSAGGDITDVAFYIQNNNSEDISMISAGGSLISYDPLSPLQKVAQAAIVNERIKALLLQSGDIQISGPGTLEVLAGGTVDLGNGPTKPYKDFNDDSSIWNGIASVGNNRNPYLPYDGADIVISAGLKMPNGLSTGNVLALDAFATQVLSSSEGETYLAELTATMTYSHNPIYKKVTASSFGAGSKLSAEERALLELQLFYIVLRDTGRNYSKKDSPGYQNYTVGEKAVSTFFASAARTGDILTRERDIRTKNGGNISMLAPGGGITLDSTDTYKKNPPFGIVTEHGGAINIYTEQSVSIGIGRIFTLRGGNIMIWSDKGDIAAGSSAKTVASAPPTRVLIDPQSGNVLTDLSGLATGGGIGVLATVADTPVGDVDLIAPSGVIDAGDAGIRSSGNLTLAATRILNADNIAASGTTSGAPAAPPPPAAPNVSGASAAAAAGAASTSTAATAAKGDATPAPEPPASIISVEVLGYGGGDAPEDSTPSPTTSSGSTPPPQAAL